MILTEWRVVEPTREGPDMQNRRLRRFADSIQIPDPFSLDALCASTGSALGIQITLQPSPLPPSSTLCGLSSRHGDGTATIMYAEDSTIDQKIVTVCHELAHLALQHEQSTEVDDDTITALVGSNLKPDVVRRMLAAPKVHAKNSRYSNAAEREAEVVGRQLAGRIMRMQAPHARPSASDDVAEMIRRFDDTFGPA